MVSKDKRLYARFDIGFDEHDKIYPLTDAAFRALVEMTLYSRRQLTDGFIAERLAVKRWGSDVLAELSSNDPERPSLVRVDDGWQIHDFSEHQTTNADIQAKRDAGSMGAAKRWGTNSDRSPIAPAMDDPMRINGGTLAKTETETETETLRTPNGVLSSKTADAALRPDVERLLDLLDDELRRNGNKVGKRSVKSRDAMRLMLDRDKRTPDQIERAIRWCQADEFWRGVILSASKLREKYDQLRLAATRKTGQQTFAQQRQSNALALVAAYEAEEAHAEVGSGEAAHVRALGAGR